MELADREYYSEDDPVPGTNWGDGEREEATTYGPFPSEDAAMDYLDPQAKALDDRMPLVVALGLVKGS